MYVLGVKMGGLESTACLIKDGVLLAAVEEERFTRQKHQKGFPYHAAKWCLSYAGITLKDIDIVTTPMDPHLGRSQMLKHLLRYLPASLFLVAERLGTLKLSHYLQGERGQIIKLLGSPGERYHFEFVPVEHHIAHASSAFYPSPFEESAVMTIDGVGEWTTTLFAYGKGTEIQKYSEKEFPHSLGFLYQVFTQYLGFEVNDGEGKVMGLAPYGNPDSYIEVFRDMVHCTEDGMFEFDLSYFDFHRYGHCKMLSNKAMKIFNNPRHPDEEVTEDHKNVAAALQKVLEEVCIHMAKALYEKTKNPNLCLAGGVALNSVMNMKLLEETPFKHLYVQAAASDSGAVIGAALYVTVQRMHTRAFRMVHAFWGPEYSDKEFEEALKHRGLSYKKVDDIERKTAQYLADGKIIGWFQGRMELGPRALGNRSIIADPRRGEMKDIINARVKHREPFRPFAPSVLAERAEEYFDMRGNESPFMLLVPQVRKEKANAIPAVIHVDGTGRVQTVTKEQNARYYRLIQEFYNLTGIPVILDTSFNIRGEPIVNTPDEAITMYIKEDMDVLALGNFLVVKS